MRLPPSIHAFVVLVLVTWMPWCLCRWVPQGCEVAAPGTAAMAANDSCGGDSGGSCCCSQDEDGTKDGDHGPAGRPPCSGCPSACCAAKLHLVQPTPTIPVDTIGVDLPPTLVALDLLAFSGVDALRSPLPGQPPGGREPPDRPIGFGGWRSHLLQASTLRT